ncbi:hypothetical protein EDD85DRAFT_958288 [Armillaria nabsnona]|nr:hypothetical protein EDD85DRAFT_958288 [Armillaria nabsnona]
MSKISKKPFIKYRCPTALHIALQFLQLNAYIEGLGVAFQASAGEAEAFRLCSSTLTLQCLASKQKAETLYSAAWIMAARKSVAQDFIQSHSIWLISLRATRTQDQLQAAQQWVSLVNTVYPPIAADPVDEDLLWLDEEAATVPISEE